jgi:hypothetical protein
MPAVTVMAPRIDTRDMWREWAATSEWANAKVQQELASTTDVWKGELADWMDEVNRLQRKAVESITPEIINQSERLERALADPDRFFGEMKKNADEWAVFMDQITRDVASGMYNSFDELFFKTMKGEFEDLGDFAEGVLNSIARATSSYLSGIWTELIFGKETGGKEKGGGFLSKAAGWLGGAIGSLFGGGSTTSYQHGGMIPEPVLGVGKSGRTYSFAETGPEWVVPERVREPEEPKIVNLTIVAADAKSFADMMRRNPEAIVGPLVEELYGGNITLRSAIRGTL